MAKSFSGEEFVKALSEDALKQPITLVGMVKPDEQSGEAIQFSEGTFCGTWTKIPVEMIERVEHLSTVRCRDHQHPLVRLVLKEPPAQNKIAVAFAELLRSSKPAGEVQTVYVNDDELECHGDDVDPGYACYLFHCEDGRMFQVKGYSKCGGDAGAEGNARNKGYRLCNDAVINYQRCP